MERPTVKWQKEKGQTDKQRSAYKILHRRLTIEQQTSLISASPERYPVPVPLVALVSIMPLSTTFLLNSKTVPTLWYFVWKHAYVQKYRIFSWQRFYNQWRTSYYNLLYNFYLICDLFVLIWLIQLFTLTIHLEPVIFVCNNPQCSLLPAMSRSVISKKWISKWFCTTWIGLWCLTPLSTIF